MTEKKIDRSDEAIQERLKATQKTDANNRLEGIKPSTGYVAKIRQQWVNGEITDAQRLLRISIHYGVIDNE